MKKTLFVVIILLLVGVTSFATPHTAIGFAYQNETNDSDGNVKYIVDLIGVEITGIAGSRVGFLYDIGVLVPLKLTRTTKTGYVTGTVTKNLNFIELNGLLGLGFQPVDEDFMLDFGFGVAFELMVRTQSPIDIAYYLGLGAHLGMGLALSDTVLLFVEAKASYFVMDGDRIITNFLSPPGVAVNPMIGICFRR